MGSASKIIVIAGIVLATTLPARATFDFVRIFSQCAGTYTAEVEHAWLLPEVDSSRLERERGEIVEILMAGLPQERARQALAMRVEARAAHRALLEHARFGGDREKAEWSSVRAAEQLGFCRSLLLKS